jgi:hypothetical protein
MLNKVVSDPLLGKFTSRGWYAVAPVSGAVAGSVAANAQLFGMVWADATYSMLVTRIVLAAKCEAFSSGIGADFQAIVVRGVTAGPSGGTAVTPAATAQMYSSADFSGSLFNSEGTIEIASTSALTAVTGTLDTVGISYAAIPGTGAGAGGAFELHRWIKRGTRPLVLAQNEGLMIRTPTGWASSNTWRVGVTVEWAEIAAGG